MEIIISVAAKIAEYTVAPVGRQLGYLFSYKTNVQNLTKQKEDLTIARVRLQDRIDEATNNCEEIYEDVLKWQSSVDEISERVDAFLREEGHAKAECSSCGSVLHLVTRHQLSRKAKKMFVHVSQVSQDNNFDQMRISRRPQNFDLPQQENSTAITKGFEDFGSRKAILKNVMVAMRDANRSRIGLCGMGGIGKTMLAKEIARQAEEKRLFSKVVLVPISQTPDLKEIQQHIADMLELEFGKTDNSMSKRASLLQQRLKPGNKILLILDDIWKELDLNEIGIHEECRMLLTSRNEEVLSNNMGIVENNIFKIKVLDREEAISLFKKIIGDIVENLDYKDLALKIVEECGGLPICIATVAHALKCSKEPHRWEDASKQLQSSNYIGINGMDDKVYSSIRFSYNFLGSHEEAKSLLLLCALHKEDAEIEVEYLMRYSVGCHLLQSVNTLKEARNRVNSLVDKLKSHCLLLEGKSKIYVKMHDVIRDVCISIAKEDEHRMNNITCATMYEKFVDDEKHKASKVISFSSYDDYDKLPQKLECPSLQLLLLSRWYLKSIPDVFFEQIWQLKALAMNDTWLRSLPQSFSSVQNLQTLCLRHSSLEDLAVVGELKSLKVLDLSWSYSIKLLPKEIGKLRCLQLLDLQGCDQLKVIEPNVISNWTQMEELYLPSAFMGWETEDGTKKERRNASLNEIRSLQQLAVLHLSVQSEYILPKEIFSGKLERYRVSIGGQYDNYDYMIDYPRGLHLNLSQMSEIITFGLELLMKKSEYLSLERLADVNNIAPCLVKEGFPRLKHLKLTQLRNLERICQGNLLVVGSFNKLREVQVRNCGRLKNLFSLSMAKQLHEIIVEECEMMEEIVSGQGIENEGDDEAVDQIIESLQLRRLELKSLPNLVHFFHTNQKATGQSSLVDHSKPLFNEMILYPHLEKLSLKKLNNTEKLWPEQHLSNSFMQNLTRLEVGNCNSLKYLFSFAQAQCFVSLRTIIVKDCKAMEDICVTTKKFGEKESQSEIILFPKLESLELSGLSAIQRFYTTDSCVEFSSPSNSISYVEHKEVNELVSSEPFFNEQVSFPNLEKLTIKSCDNLKYLLSFSLAQQKFVKLKKIEVRNCKAMKDIGLKFGEEGNHLEMILFPKLESLELVGLLELQRFCATDSCIEFPLLSRLAIHTCPKLKTFISSPTTDHQEVNQLASTKSFFNEKVSFPNLEELTIESCDNLKYLLSFSLAQQKLKKIKVKDCKAMKDIGLKVGEEEIQMKMILFPKLESLELVGLSDLQRFCASDSCMEFPLLSNLAIEDCPKLKTFVSSPTLDHKEVNQLLSIQYFFNEKLQKIWFLKLKSLKLQGFPDLKSFCASDSCMEFPFLTKLTIVDCPKLKTFVSSSTPDDQEENQLLSAKVSFPNLEELYVQSCENLKYLFSFSLAQQKFVKLKRIQVIDCKAMKDIGVKVGEEGIQLEMILLPKLESLVLRRLSDLQRFCATDSCMEFPLLSKLYIQDCAKLKTFISSPTTGLQELNQLASTQFFFNEKTTFPNLKELTIWRCDNLKYLLSFANVRSLVQLETLIVWECKNIENVIVGDMESWGSNAIIFEKLQTLELVRLPNLVKFCEGDCIECPLLSELWICNAPKMKEFISNSTGKRACIVSEEMGMVEVPEQTFFIDKVTSHNLKELITNWSEVVEEIFERKSSQSSLIFSNLSKLDVAYEPKDKTIAISDVRSFLHKYHNIHSLELGGSFVDGHQRQQPGHGLSDGDGETCELMELVITSCSRLKSIEWLSTYFHKLEILKIEGCNGLTCLFTISTAAILLQLKEMKIKNCSGVKEVINTDYYDDETEHHPLVFHSLHKLELENLRNLKSFYSGNEVMSFPKLISLSVERCPEMMTFSNGIISTHPYLERIDGIEKWEEDVNTTVRKHWEDSNLGLDRLLPQEKDDDDDEDCEGNA